MNRIARVVLAGAVGAIVALWLVLLRPSGGPFDAAQYVPAAPSPASALRNGTPGAGSTESAAGSASEGSASSVGEQLAVAPPSFIAQRPGAVVAAIATPTARTDPARSIAGTEPRNEGEAEPEDGPERPALWCFLKSKDDHDYVSDSDTVWNGSRSVWIGKQNDAEADGGYFSHDILWQGVDATAFRGLRIEVSAEIKGRGYLQFFVRTATAMDGGIVLHDSQLPSVPTTNRHVNLFAPLGVDWARFSIVADVPVEADVVYYGISLMGGRAISIDDVRIAMVDRETPLTLERSIGGRFILPVNAAAALGAPTNLDFEVTTRDAAGC